MNDEERERYDREESMYVFGHPDISPVTVPRWMWIASLIAAVGIIVFAGALL